MRRSRSFTRLMRKVSRRQPYSSVRPPDSVPMPQDGALQVAKLTPAVFPKSPVWTLARQRKPCLASKEVRVSVNTPR
jgi:hypothetical protein